MDRDLLDENQILRRFDGLVSQGILVYDHHHLTHKTYSGIWLQFRILPTIAFKPMYAVVDGQPENSPPPAIPNPRPGSDINVTGYEIANYGTSHLLTFNKFPATRPHILLLNQDGFRRQYEPLDREDLAAMWNTVETLNRNSLINRKMMTYHLAIYNCGFDSGCSRLHKHMQVFPVPSSATFTPWPYNINDEVLARTVPFKHHIFRFGEGATPTSDDLLQVYRALLRLAERDLIAYRSSETNFSKIERLEGAAIPHNVIIDRGFVLVIPRQAAGWNGVDANAAGMLGMVWVPTAEKANRWLELGGDEVLARLGVPSETYVKAEHRDIRETLRLAGLLQGVPVYDTSACGEE